MNNEKICIGCGAKLQDENISLEGYTSNIENDICSRCFRMKNYGEYQIIAKSNEEYIEILKEVDKTKDLVLYIVDSLNFGEDITSIREYISNNIILVLNKRDVLPKSVKDNKLKEYLKNFNLDFKDIIVVGNTNVGKSSLINKLIKNYSEYEGELTISPMPSTTLNKISIKLSDDLTIIDTPGLVNRGNIINYVDNSLLKKINPRKEIKPKTYQIKVGQCLVIGDLFRIDYVEGEKNSFTLYVSNDLKVKRYNMNKCTLLKDKPKTSYEIGYHKDLVIDGLGFIKIVSKASVDVYVDINVNVFEREALI